MACHSSNSRIFSSQPTEEHQINISSKMVAQEESSTSPNAEMPSPMEGKFTYVGLDVDATGRRLIDEIIHIAAYTPKDSFTQHIMPLMNLNPGARQRHQIRVITVGFFRMLKSMQTYKASCKNSTCRNRH